MTNPQILSVTADTIDTSGFFCKMSGKGSEGYARKAAWLAARFDEGLQLRMLGDGERGFVEFIPGPYAWRAIENAEDFVVIHCLWVVGKSRGKGFGNLLLDEVEGWARYNGYRGVAAVISGGNWLIDSPILEARGYASVDSVAPNFDLLVKKFDRRINAPRFCGGFAEKLAARPGLVVYRTDQCPYLDDATRIVRTHARQSAIPFQEVEMRSAEEVRALSPTPYGTFAVVQDGRLLSYHYMLPKQIAAAA